jgi:hypothetical protein
MCVVINFDARNLVSVIFILREATLIAGRWGIIMTLQISMKVRHLGHVCGFPREIIFMVNLATYCVQDTVGTS